MFSSNTQPFFLTSGALVSSFLSELVLGVVVDVVGRLELVSVEGAVSLVEGMLFFSFSVVVVSCVVSAELVCRCFSSAKAGFVANPRKVSVMALAKSVFFTCLISYFLNNLFLKCH